MNIGEVLSEMREMSEINSNFRMAADWADTIEAVMRERDAEIESLNKSLLVHMEGYLDAQAEIERLQRACVGAIRFLGLVKNPDAHRAEALLRAALAGKQP